MVTAAAATAANGVEDRVSGGSSSSRVSCEDGSKPPDEADFPDAGYNDMADYIDRRQAITTMQQKKRCTETSIHVTMTITTIAHTQQPTALASTSHNKPYHETQQRRYKQKDTARAPKKRKRMQWWPSENIVKWIEDAKKSRPLPQIEIMIYNEQRKRKNAGK